MERGDFFSRFVLTVVRDELKCRIAAGEGDGQAGDFMTPAKPGHGHSAPVGTEKLFIFESDCSPLLLLSHRFTGFGKNNHECRYPASNEGERKGDVLRGVISC